MDSDALLNLDVDVHNRLIYVMGEINSDLSKNVLKGINLLKTTSLTDPIFMYVHSDGGDVDAGLAIYDAIRRSKTPIHTIGTGAVCSAALLILVCGHRRFCTENVFAMAHGVHYTAAGNVNEIASQSRNAEQVNSRMLTLLASHTKYTIKQWKSKMATEGEVWLNARDLFTAGAVDEIIYNERLKKALKRSVKKPT